MKENNIKLHVQDETPIQTSYQLELDISPKHKREDGAYYQSLVGIFICMVELGRIDIYLEVYMILICLAIPK